eukprot:gene2757-3430_t
MSSTPTPTSTTTTTTTSTNNNVVNNNNGPVLQIGLRSKTQVHFQSGPKYGKNETLPTAGPECRHIEYSKDGTLVAIVNVENVLIYKTESGQLYSQLDRANIVMVSFSPQNSFFLTWERFSETNNNENNLLVWDLQTKQVLYKTSQKYCNAENWPLIKWTDDEVLAGKLNHNEVHFFNGRSIGNLAKKIKLPDIAYFDFAPGDSPYRICTFVPEKKGTPGSAKIYVYPNVNEHSSHLSFFKANEAKLYWNRKGNALLIHTQTDTDKTGKSYYGETGLWFLSLDGTSFNLGIKGPIHDVKWSPTLDQFIVVYGSMPSQSTLYNIKGNPLVDFGLNPHNTIRFSPNGKLLCLGGFGNLQGDMDFWDLTRYKKISSTNSYCATYCEWAADSLHFLTAVLSPRIRVDNGIKLIKYDSTVIYKESIPELYQAQWRPQSSNGFPEEKIIIPHPSSVKETSPQPQKYTPPSQRAAAAAATAATEKSKGPVVPNGFKIYLTVGGQSTTGSGSSSPSTSSNNSKPKPKPVKDQNNNSTTTTTTTSPKPADQPKKILTEEEQKERKIKNIERKIKEVEILKSKLESGEFLPPTALEKINNEHKFIDELKSLKI